MSFPSDLSTREINSLVAEKVMNYEPWPDNPGTFKRRDEPWHEPRPVPPPEYCTELNAAWSVVMRMRENNFNFTLVGNNRKFQANFHKGSVPNLASPYYETMSEAICKEALRAVL